MAQCLGAGAALAEDLILIPNTPMVAHNLQLQLQGIQRLLASADTALTCTDTTCNYFFFSF